MGLTRVFRRSIRFTFRSKRRFIVFLLIFAIVSTLVAFYIDELDTLTTDQLLPQKGVVVHKVEGTAIDYPDGKALYDEVLDFADNDEEITIESSMLYTYADIDSKLRIHNLDIDNPWLSEFAKPSLIQEGHFPNSPDEVLVPAGAFQARNITVGSEEIELKNIMSVGQELEFSNGDGEEITLKIVGTFDDSNYKISNQQNQLWLFMDQSKFEDMLDLFGMTEEEDAKVYMGAFVIEGMILLEETYQKVDRLNDEVESILESDSRYNNFEDVPQSLPLPQTIQNANTIAVTLAFVVIGGIILSTLFAYLISRFRRKEIAILKAMGYSHAAVRTSLIAEILTTSFGGFVIGLGAAQSLLIYLHYSQTNDIDFSNLIRIQAVGYAFLIMVVIALPGMLLASRRVLSVSPAEAFRDN